MSTCCPVFNTSRMVQEYMERCYAASADRFGRLTGEALARAKELAQWRHRLQRDWSQIRIQNVEPVVHDPIHVGGEMEVHARVDLGLLNPDDVEVQLFHGIVDNHGDIPKPSAAVMLHNGAHQGSTWLFKGVIPCRSSGQFGYAVRVLPKNADLANQFEPGLITWG